MGEYERDIAIEAPAEEVFQFVSTVSNFPRFLPSVQAAEGEPGGPVRVVGVWRGKPYHGEGFLNIDPGRLRMEWGSNLHPYGGWLEVRRGDTSPTVCEITVHLSMAQRIDQQSESAPGQQEEEVQAMLWDALNNIRRAVIEARRQTQGSRGG